MGCLGSFIWWTDCKEHLNWFDYHCSRAFRYEGFHQTRMVAKATWSRIPVSSATSHYLAKNSQVSSDWVSSRTEERMPSSHDLLNLSEAICSNQFPFLTNLLTCHHCLLECICCYYCFSEPCFDFLSCSSRPRYCTLVYFEPTSAHSLSESMEERANP